MKIKQLILAGSIAVMTPVLGGCGTTVGPAKTTLAPMKGVNPLTSVKRTTEVTSTSTNITMVENIRSPEQGQFELRMKELEGQTGVGVAKANRPGYIPGYVSYGYGYTTPYYPYYYNGYKGGPSGGYDGRAVIGTGGNYYNYNGGPSGGYDGRATVW